MVPTYGVDGGMCPPFQGKPWTNGEDPARPLWAMCAKGVKTGATLGIPVTTPPEVPTTFVEDGGRTRRLVGVKGVVGMFSLGAPTGGGGTPSTVAAKVEIKELSPTVDIILPTGTPITGGSKGRTWTNTGFFKLVKGVLKFLANSSACKSYISTVLKSKWLALSVGSPRTSPTLIGSNELLVSNLLL